MYATGELFRGAVPVYVHTGSGFPPAPAPSAAAEPVPSASNGAGGHRIDTVIVEIFLSAATPTGRRVSNLSAEKQAALIKMVAGPGGQITQ